MIGRPMKILPDMIHGARVVRDLGMVDRGWKRPRRCCLLECPDCKSIRRVCVGDAKNGGVRCKECGTRESIRISKTHGLYGTRLYRIWGGMLQRCTNPNRKSYKRYGGRGIAVCDEWQKPEAFVTWAVSSGYAKHLTIDRIDNDGNYEPSNCRWVMQTVQARNSCRLTRCNTSGYRGVTLVKASGKWGAHIRIEGKLNHLGLFTTAREAGRAYDAYVLAHALEHTINATEVCY